jgi:GntR family transcriptional regulator, transcriptional repressor for pyruvate dehydrogenase complex
MLVKARSTAERVAIVLRARILSLKEGTHMGPEASIAAEVGVSLPTLRQASRMLEYEGLLTIKPGKGGGYFTSRPAIDTVTKSASQFLSSSGLSTNAAFMDVADPLVIHALKTAVKCKDERLIDELRLFSLGKHESGDNNHLPHEYGFKVSTDLMVLIARMSDNILLELFLGILWNQVNLSRFTGTFEGNREIMVSNQASRISFAEAILSKDEDKAISAWKKRSKLIRSWPERGFEFLGQLDNSLGTLPRN